MRRCLKNRMQHNDCFVFHYCWKQKFRSRLTAQPYVKPDFLSSSEHKRHVVNQTTLNPIMNTKPLTRFSKYLLNE